jgi:hypothetical protein
MCAASIETFIRGDATIRRSVASVPMTRGQDLCHKAVAAPDAILETIRRRTVVAHSIPGGSF